MRRSVKSVLSALKALAVRRPKRMEVPALGGVRLFRAYDVGNDTFVFQRGVWMDLDHHASVLIVNKADLKPGGRGHLMTVTTGNHAVAALPLLGGKLWDLAAVAPARRSEVMAHRVLCANVVQGKLELSQRDVPVEKVIELDAWLTHDIKFDLDDVIFLDRNDATLDVYRMRGQEWRVKPLAWTGRDMALALGACRKRIASTLRYYHGSRGVHFLSWQTFQAFVARARTHFDEFRTGLRELVGVYEGEGVSYVRQEKLHAHHEVEFFGIVRGKAFERLIPDLEALYADIEAHRIAQDEAIARAEHAVQLFKSLLIRPELADDSSPAFVESLYVHVTGEIYALAGDGSAPAFDDRRTALPGASYSGGTPKFHPGADRRTQGLFSNLRLLTGKDEVVEYANVYELHDDASHPVGMGATREIVYKTNYRPLVTSLVEKRLSMPGRFYGAYVMARIQAFKALGVSLPNYRLLKRHMHASAVQHDYYIRSRALGEPLSAIPPQLFRRPDDVLPDVSVDDVRVVYALAALMGLSAAQNMVLKKYDAATNSPLYGVGKEIYNFAYDVRSARLMPSAVSLCSIRGTCSWPDRERTDENFRAFSDFYLTCYVACLRAFAAAHPTAAREQILARFLEGFESEMRALARTYVVQRQEFDAFSPPLPARYAFADKWHFALWALECQVEQMSFLRTLFRRKFEMEG